MELASDKNGYRVDVSFSCDSEEYFCPSCGEKVFAKCGDIRIHHWSHFKDTNCIYFKNAEGEWHRNWKRKFPEDCREIKNDVTGRIHDVVFKNQPYEFQNSKISAREILDRSAKSKLLIPKWIFSNDFVGDNINYWWSGEDGRAYKRIISIDSSAIALSDIFSALFNGGIGFYIDDDYKSEYILQVTYCDTKNQRAVVRRVLKSSIYDNQDEREAFYDLFGEKPDADFIEIDKGLYQRICSNLCRANLCRAKINQYSNKREISTIDAERLIAELTVQFRHSEEDEKEWARTLIFDPDDAGDLIS